MANDTLLLHQVLADIGLPAAPQPRPCVRRGKLTHPWALGARRWQSILVLIDVPHGGKLDPRQLRG
jgi:hypothetical protein